MISKADSGILEIVFYEWTTFDMVDHRITVGTSTGVRDRVGANSA